MDKNHKKIDTKLQFIEFNFLSKYARFISLYRIKKI